MIDRYIKILVLALTIALFNCSSGGGDDPGPGPQPVDNPEAAILVLPLKDAECNQGNIISATESNVTFEWNASNFTTSYTLVLTNLDTDEVKEFSTSNTTITEALLRGTPYSWKIISKSTATTSTSTSETWKLYNAGDGVENYVPFPAELVSPPMGGLSSVSASLKWVGSDVDNDIEEYDVYLGTNNPPTNLYETTTNTNIDNVSLTANTVYYWIVVTKDAHGNNSESPVFEFRTE